MRTSESNLVPPAPERRVGLPPGSVVFVGEERTAPIEFRILEYSPDHFLETDEESVDDVLKYRDTTPVTWINVNGVHDESVIQRMGEHFHVHPLIQEDIAHTGQRPKLEPHEEYLYLVVKMLYFDDRDSGLRAEQVSLLVGERNLISFQEDPGDVFDPVRKRIRTGRGHIRERGPDYLAYALLDVIVDHYFVVLDALGARTEDLEDEIVEERGLQDMQADIHDLRRDLIFMRRMTWPMRELLYQLERLESPLWDDNNQPYVRDTYGHVVQVLDLVEALRDTASGLHDLHMTSISNRMNEIMKVLTIIGTIFIPLTFIAGVYGMNFEYMPELGWPWAYPAVWGLMIGLAVGLLLFFRRSEWI